LINGDQPSGGEVLLADKHPVNVTSNHNNRINWTNWVVDLGGGQRVTVHRWKGNLGVTFFAYCKIDFHDTIGLVGNFYRKKKKRLIGRDGTTDYTHKPDEYGQEWQVRGESLFSSVPSGHPEYPQCCLEAETKKTHRNLLRFVREEASHESTLYSRDSFVKCHFSYDSDLCILLDCIS